MTISMMVGSRTAQGTTAACPEGENVYLIDPVVVVIEGPGDAAAEQARWSALEYSQLEGPLQISLGLEVFQLEAVP